MKLLLIQPLTPGSIENRRAPLGINYVAESCRQKFADMEIMVYDQQALNAPELEEIYTEFQADIVGVSIVSVAINQATKIISTIKTLNPEAFCIAGGPHPTALPEMTLSRGFDCVVRGEGEITFTELIEVFQKQRKLEDVDGISYIDSAGQPVHTPEREYIQNLDSLPFPLTHFNSSGYEPIVNISFIRGCPMSCTFCATAHKKKVRLRSPESMVDEIEFMYNEHGVKQFCFPDSLFTIRHDIVEKMCDLILERHLDISWYAQSRVDCITKELAEKMKSAGCNNLTFGMESASEAILKNIKKKQSVKKMEKAIEICREVGMKCTTFWIAGLPGSMEEQLKSIDFMVKNQPDIIEVYLCAILPGTELWDRAKENGIHIDKSALQYDQAHAHMWENNLRITDLDIDYMTNEQIFTLAEQMLERTQAAGYITDDEYAQNPEEHKDKNIIFTFLDEGIRQATRI